MGKLFTELMRRLFGLLDNIVIFLIETLYNLIMMIADTNVLGDLIYHYLGRIYVFLGIFMVFKLSFSMITYIVNPDELTDKGKGFGKLISNVIISLILLVATPTLFNVAFDIQSDILKTNAIYQIVTGRRLSNDTAADNNNKMGKKIAYGIYSTFIYKEAANDNYNVNLSEDISALTDSVTNGKCDNDSNPYCLVDMDTLLKKAESGSGFANKYWYLVSTICGGFVTYILLIFCFDTAVRSVKLGFLQIIAPIPILSMIDPKKGTEKVMKWGKECGKTFADLFIRLAGLFFVVDIIGVILGTNGDIKGMYTYTTGNQQTNLFVRLFVIIGLLMFAKQMPQLISDLLGIKLDGGGFSLKKKMGDIPGLGAAKALGAGALGFAGGMAANTLAARKNFSWDKNQGFWKNMGKNTLGFGKSLGSVAAGGVSGLGRGTFSKEKNMFKAAGAGVAGAVGARNLRDERVAAGLGGPKGWLGRRGDDINKFAGISTDDANKLAAERALGEKMYKESKTKGKYGIYSNGDFAQAAKNADNAKDLRDSKQSEYEVAQLKYQRGDSSITAEQVNALRVNAAKASSTYDKAKAELEKQKTLHADDAKKYDAFSAAEDRHKVIDSAGEPSSIPESPTTSSPEVFVATKDTTVKTPSGGSVDVHQGEKVTKSGIIIGNDSNWNKK